MQEVAQAREILRRGGLVAFPTETVYGLGARADQALAVARIFEAKARPTFDPLITHFADVDSIAAWAQMSPLARRIGERFWPGPLTLVLPRRRLHGAALIPDLVTAGLDTVGVRIPDQPMALALLAELGFPVAAPSANPFGYVSPTCADHVRDGLGDRVDLILDGGPCRVGVESTILDLSGQNPRLLRPGGIPREALEEVLGQILPWEGFRPPVATEAPGMLESHYSPRSPVEVFESPEDLVERAESLGGRCALVSAQVLPAPCRRRRILGEGAAMAANLFAVLRELDREEPLPVLALLPPPEGLGLAVRDRLFRAAGSRLGARPDLG